MKQYNTQQKKKIVLSINKVKNKRIHSALNYDTPMLYFKKIRNT
ncbi:hypothetical protein [Brachyspira sp.]|nr:hypothetical protein [Brachyspira sp.]